MYDNLEPGMDYEAMKKIIERMGENGGVIAPPNYFTQVPDMFVRRKDLNVYEKILFIYIWGFAANKGHAFPSNKRMQDELGMSKNTIIKNLTSLEEKGGLYIVNQFKKSNGQQVANLYFLAEVNVQTGEFISNYLDMQRIMHPDRKRILENL